VVPMVVPGCDGDDDGGGGSGVVPMVEEESGLDSGSRGHQ
jgi:hypothetical protein